MVELRALKHLDEIEQLVDLFRLSFNLDMSPELWNWKYLQNPLASAAAEVVVALDKGKVVGARPFLLTEMWLDNKRVLTAQHCDTMVHPDYQNQGIFNRMGKVAIQYLKENNYALSYGFPAPISRPGFLRQGWRVVVPTETMFRVVHPQKVISNKLKNKSLGNVLGFFYDKFLNSEITEKRQPSSSFQVEIFDRYTEELKSLDNLRDDSVIDLVRSEANLRWRFDQHPEYSYKYILARRGGELWGYAVVSVQEKADGLVYGIITDYLVKSRDIACFQALIKSSLDELGKSGCDVIYTWAFSEPEFREQLSKHLGFKSSSRFPYNRVSYYGYLDALLIDERIAERVDIYDKESWRVTCAFLDSV